MGRRGFGTVWKPHDRDAYYIAFRLGRRLKRIIRKGGTLAQSRRLLSLIETEVHNRRSPEEILHIIFGDPYGPQMTFADLCGEYVKRPKKRASENRTAESDEYLIDQICRAKWAQMTMGGLKSSDIQRYLDEVCTRTTGPTANRHRSKISAVFSWGLPRGHVERNLAKDTVKYDESGRERETYLTKEECRALVAVASDLLKPVLILALSTGMRQGAILDLRWRNIVFEVGDYGVVELDPGTGSKRKAPRIPMTPDLRIALTQHQATRAKTGPDDRVFPYQGRRVSDHFDRAVAACEAITPEKKPKVTFHTTRHTAASLMVQADVRLEEVSRILGHATLEMTRRYAHFAPDWSKKPIERLGEQLNLGLLGEAPPVNPPDSPLSGGGGQANGQQGNGPTT